MRLDTTTNLPGIPNYEAGPLVCPRCKHTMRTVAFIVDDTSIQTILKHLRVMGDPFSLDSPRPMKKESMRMNLPHRYLFKHSDC
mgnify:CR=1 FL=1